MSDYRIAVRPHRDGDVADVVVTRVDMFRMEDMGQSWWVCCHLGDGQSIVFDIDKRTGRCEVVEWPDRATYEEGSLQP